jgi:Asp/Glu/hydantoin racemase
MSSGPRIGLVHALQASMAPIEAAFREQWPQAETIHLFDQSLYVDYDKVHELTPAIYRRIDTLLHYSASTGASAILFTGSLFGAAVEAAREKLNIPVLTAYEAMIEAAFAAGTRLGLLATLADTVTIMRADIERYARAQGLDYHLDARLVAGAMAALREGDRDTHDRLIAEAAIALSDRDALMLGQFSMAPVLNRLPAELASRVLTSPASAVTKLKRLLNAA